MVIPLSGSVVHTISLARCIRAVRATEHAIPNFYSMPDDVARAVTAGWCNRLNRTFKAVERMTLPIDMNLKALVVFIPANFASGHRPSSRISFVHVAVLRGYPFSSPAT
jgi:hypothetical protein